MNNDKETNNDNTVIDDSTEKGSSMEFAPGTSIIRGGFLNDEGEMEEFSMSGDDEIQIGEGVGNISVDEIFNKLTDMANIAGMMLAGGSTQIKPQNASDYVDKVIKEGNFKIPDINGQPIFDPITWEALPQPGIEEGMEVDVEIGCLLIRHIYLNGKWVVKKKDYTVEDLQLQRDIIDIKQQIAEEVTDVNHLKQFCIRMGDLVLPIPKLSKDSFISSLSEVIDNERYTLTECDRINIASNLSGYGYYRLSKSVTSMLLTVDPALNSIIIADRTYVSFGLDAKENSVALTFLMDKDDPDTLYFRHNTGYMNMWSEWYLWTDEIELPIDIQELEKVIEMILNPEITQQDIYDAHSDNPDNVTAVVFSTLKIGDAPLKPGAVVTFTNDGKVTMDIEYTEDNGWVDRLNNNRKIQVILQTFH